MQIITRFHSKARGRFALVLYPRFLLDAIALSNIFILPSQVIYAIGLDERKKDSYTVLPTRRRPICITVTPQGIANYK
jgi:hypothetical protein